MDEVRHQHETNEVEKLNGASCFVNDRAVALEILGGESKPATVGAAILQPLQTVEKAQPDFFQSVIREVAQRQRRFHTFQFNMTCIQK
jgi:hypothetical protein